MAITLLIAFLYGGMVWGVFPQFFPRERISWESHLMGLLAGLILAIYYRKAGPQRIIFEWEDEEDENDDHDPEDTMDNHFPNDNPEINYFYQE